MFSTPGGACGLVARDGRLVATYLPGQPERIRRRIRQSWPEAIQDDESTRSLQRQFIDYFAGRRRRFDVELDLSGVPAFHRVVYEACRRIPFGETASYAELAKRVGNPRAARAVGQAMSRNPIPLVIPCHRVLRADGSIGGFSSPRGLAQKRQLLALEGIEDVGGRRPA
jgi:methylated-DNA-[protein]-cysteine S-methyltransferase